MSGMRQKSQIELAFPAARRGEAPMAAGGGTEPRMAKCEAEGPAIAERLMEEVCKRENLKRALKRVQANRGSPGVLIGRSTYSYHRHRHPLLHPASSLPSPAGSMTAWMRR